MPSAPEIYGTSVVLDAKPDSNGHLDIAILALAYTSDGHVLDASIYDNTWHGFKDIK